MRQHPVVVAELDLCLPPEGHNKREFPVAEAIEVQGAVQACESGDQLETNGLGSFIKAQPSRIHAVLLSVALLLSVRGHGDRSDDQHSHRYTEPARPCSWRRG